MPTFTKSESFAHTTANLDQTFEHNEREGLVDLGPTILPRQFVHDDKISSSVTHLLNKFEYISLFEI